MPKTMMTSPGLARREAYPEMAPGGATKVAKSGNSAPKSCAPPIFRYPGANIPAAVGFTTTGYAALVPVAAVTVICCTPVETFDGTSAFTWPGLM